MTTPKTDAPAPPRDYGNGDEWATDGPWGVPEDLWPYYATAEPSDVQKAGYMTYGASVVENVEHQVQRLVASGRDDGEPVTVAETRVVPTLVDIAGASGYRPWLHRTRLTIAQHAKRRADILAASEARWRRCSVCGTRSPSVRTASVRVAANIPRLNVTGCPDCLPVLEDNARAALTERAADHRLHDGHRVGDVAADVVAGLLTKDGAS
ncbi:hypothetical protein EKO23_15245 [Nocardioides guangzhouensis]|uniref:Uncharacterized protein n=1 Tax=Nocardioides guangzhouensis TaxID=2497878 RepID=A0A4Q4Z9M7_9ACTN|nr:hypothetical protein [Nocardioides guangzhouensis]RYP84617.1 hypothetical protein EKO23_15245 [Nocardioides guangzhouensis]